MTNTELNDLTISQLRELNQKVVSMIKLKMHIAGKLNEDNLCIGMTVKYKGSSPKLENETFEIKKIAKVNAQCKSLISGLTWNIKLANIEPCEVSN